MDSAPQEIVLSIVEQLDKVTDLCTILNLRLVSKKWLQVATPFIYVIAQDPYWPCDSHRKHDLGVLTRLNDKLAVRPDLACIIKELHMFPLRIENRVRTRIPLALMNRNRQQWEILNGLKFLPLELKLQIIRDLTSDVDSGLVAFVLLLCRDIEVLEIEQRYFHFGPSLRGIFHLAANANTNATAAGLPGALPPNKDMLLSKLTRLKIGDKFECVTINDVLTFLSLPRLQHLEVDGLIDYYDNGFEDDDDDEDDQSNSSEEEEQALTPQIGRAHV